MVSSPANTGPVPTGDVAFSMDPAAVSDETLYDLDENGAATWDLMGLGTGQLIAVGLYNVKAHYGGIAITSRLMVATLLQ